MKCPSMMPILCFIFMALALPSHGENNIKNKPSNRCFWERMIEKSRLIYQRKGYVHWYTGEGMEEGEFPEDGEELDPPEPKSHCFPPLEELEEDEDLEGEPPSR